jgi:hypothetical protein
MHCGLLAFTCIVAYSLSSSNWIDNEDSLITPNIISTDPTVRIDFFFFEFKIRNPPADDKNRNPVNLQDKQSLGVL